MSDQPKLEFILDFVESADGEPTGRVRRIRLISGGTATSEQELFLDPAALRAEAGKGGGEQ